MYEDRIVDYVHLRRYTSQKEACALEYFMYALMSL